MIDIDEGGRAELFRLAAAADPDECCGLISDDDGALTFYPTENKAEFPSAGFAIDPDEMQAVMHKMVARGEQLVAVYHSHPGSALTPSTEDIENAAAFPGLTWVIVGRSVCGGCRGEGEIPAPRPEGGVAAATVTCTGCEGAGTVPDLWQGVLA